jgi:large subunit ribosomal protein L22
MVTAKLNKLRISPRKVRLVADVIRGMQVEQAERQLQFLNRKPSLPLLKLLRSAIANAENNNKLEKENLYIKELRVDEGASLKRWIPRAMGRASAMRKRTSHITIVLDEIKVSEKKEDFEKNNQKEVKPEEKKEDKSVK